MDVGVEPKAAVGDMFTDEQLILFLHCCQHSLEACKQTIEAYYTIRTHAPELFGNRDPRRKGIQEAMSTLWVQWAARHFVFVHSAYTYIQVYRYHFRGNHNVWSDILSLFVSLNTNQMQTYYLKYTSGRHINPYRTAFPYGNGMVLHFYQQQESSTTKTIHRVINKGLKAYV